MDGLLDHAFGILTRPVLQMDAQLERFVDRKLARPAHDEVLRVIVEVLFKERRRVHRVEQLADIMHFEADAAELLRLGKAGSFGCERVLHYFLGRVIALGGTCDLMRNTWHLLCKTVASHANFCFCSRLKSTA